MFRPIRNISTTGTASSATQFSNLSLDNLTGPRRAMVSDHLVSWGFDGIRIAGWRSRILTALLRNEKRKMLVIQLAISGCSLAQPQLQKRAPVTDLRRIFG
ncbi:hypothetical protein CPAR01_04558 [Colletotrichum paranaense]|uniref:Uncharacterized protein n=1 Tax=Colletotrichum paranaense TaxID=1914294 RepID=A0ABQ9SWP0_9PEZI|nr:uncharacterized protein CPAR01_04558 [Colletotrichum paranaense]KAK1543925.1 hypothetical protein CPAR01_04558 [Colletotrichum paranaense]